MTANIIEWWSSQLSFWSGGLSNKCKMIAQERPLVRKLNLKLYISEVSSLQIPTDDIVWVLSDLISISGAIENLFAGQSEFNQGDNFPAS